MKRKLIFPLTVFLVSVLLMAIQKPLFLLWYAELAAQAGWTEWWSVVWHGLKLDCTTAGYITSVPLILTLVSLWVRIPQRWASLGLKIYFTLLSLFTAAIVAVDMGLYAHWGFRIDATILTYLADPKEAMASVDWLTGVKQTALFLVFATILIFGYFRTVRLFDGEPLRRSTAAWGTVVVLLLCGLDFLAIRGGVGASTANISKVYFSDRAFLNHAATNPVFSFLSSLSDRDNLAERYPFFSEEERAERFEQLRGNRESDSTCRVLRTAQPNVVLVIMESFGRTLTDAEVAGQSVTPRLRQLKEEGIWFENFFANSFRTDRGEVAILSGFPAQTNLSIMKMPNKSRSLPSVARSMAEAGYTTRFYYGGDLNFTNQSAYMYATGWQELIWQKDLSFDRPTQRWGWDDEVMCAYFADEVIALSEEKRPFLATLLTLSSHPPFDVPEEVIPDAPHPMLNATAFTDKQIGAMIDRLKASAAWENLLVVLVADHGYPYPETLLYNEPLRHRIPMLWLGGAIETPMEVTAYASQIDLIATLLGQLGLPHDDFEYSKDIFSPTSPEFAYYTFNDGFGVVTEDDAVVYDCTTDRLLQGSSEKLTDMGRTMLQTTYCDIQRR